jgi:hypothetical protein
VGAQHLLVFNPSTFSRQSLRLAHSADGAQWATERDLEDGVPGQEFSYPAMAWADRSLWVSYTDQRKSIAWQRLNWVADGGPAAPAAAQLMPASASASAQSAAASAPASAAPTIRAKP